MPSHSYDVESAATHRGRSSRSQSRPKYKPRFHDDGRPRSRTDPDWEDGRGWGNEDEEAEEDAPQWHQGVELLFSAAVFYGIMRYLSDIFF